MAKPRTNFLQRPSDNPYLTLSTNFGLPYTCQDLCTRIFEAPSLKHLLKPGYDGFLIKSLGRPGSPSDPYLPSLLWELSRHEDICTIFLEQVNWSFFNPSRHVWHASITAFRNVTYLGLIEVSLLGEELCSLIRSFPLQGLELHKCSITNALPLQPLAIDPETIMLNQQGPEIENLIITVGEDSSLLEFFTQLWSPLSFRELGGLSISGKGGRDSAQEIVRLVEISDPFDLSINCDNLYLGNAPPILTLCDVRKLSIFIPFDGAKDFQRTSDCLWWWIASLKEVPQDNDFAEISIKFFVNRYSITYLPTGRSMIPWIHFDEALSDWKFKLYGRFSAISLRADEMDMPPFDPQLYDEWIRSYALVRSFTSHLGNSFRRRA
ncbi:uncharacterized protein EV420DRAFT_1641475 [Desarmillaria tabescens]|uniref:Uncharacterized protein n=1 Tax=Armillaria tabescens TaxID=1929756 RepID=A0AA39N7B7_ARMTA|nr:uncharacterized protein EV420DRAFT_1641475 [Desarmillaria tabescens]KAK0460145.1 hypothetical protein EV420DRAFT_1641475 [Desarmillaria tabescens]